MRLLKEKTFIVYNFDFFFSFVEIVCLLFLHDLSGFYICPFSVSPFFLLLFRVSFFPFSSLFISLSALFLSFYFKFLSLFFLFPFSFLSITFFLSSFLFLLFDSSLPSSFPFFFFHTLFGAFFFLISFPSLFLNFLS